MKRTLTALVVCCALLMGAVTVINLATQVTGILGKTNGGTGLNSSATFPSSGTIIGTGTSALTAGTTVSVDFSLATVYTLTPAQAETINATNCSAGKSASIVVTTSGTTSFVLTFSTNFKTVGTLTTGTTTAKVFNISFMCNGTTATEMSRTTAM
jgi:hypothetical protein